MADLLRDIKLPPAILAVVIIAVVAGSMSTPLLWLTGAISGNTIMSSDVANMKQQMSGLVTQQDATILKTQISTLTTLVTQLQADLRLAPRSDQLVELDRRVEQLRGQLSAFDNAGRESDRRISYLEGRQREGDSTSRAPLRPR